MEVNELPLAYSNLLLRHIVFEVVSHIVNLTQDEAKKALYRYLHESLPPMSQPFNPNRTEGMVVNQMLERTTNPTDPALMVSQWKQLESTDQIFSVSIHALIVSLIELVNNTRGFLKSMVSPKADEIAAQIVQNRLSLAPISEGNPPIDPYAIISAAAKNKAFPMMPPQIEVVKWDQLENMAFLSGVVSDIRTTSNISFEGGPSKEWLPKILKICRDPLNIETHPETLKNNILALKRILEDITGESEDAILNIFSYPSGYRTLLNVYENSLFSAPSVLDILDRLQVLKNIGVQVLSHPNLPTNLKPYVMDIMYRLDVMLLGIQCARADVFGKSYILAVTRDDENSAYTMLINSDQEYIAKQLGINPTDAYDVFLYWIFEHKRLFPANGLETSYVAEKKDKATNWVLQKAIEASKLQRNDLDHIHRQAAYPALMKGLQSFLKANGIVKGVGEIERAVERAIEFMDMFPEKATLVIMELLLHFTPYQMAKTLCKLYTSYSDVTKMPVSSMEAILSEFVRVILLEKVN